MINYSFIIPHHNGPILLNRLLDSIPQRKDIEIIVVDDNSDELKRPKITRSDVQIIYISEANSKGAGHARNIGLEKAKGQWLLFADSDDCYVEGFVDELDKYLESEVDIVFFNAYIGYNNTKPYEVKIPNFFDIIYKDFEESKKTDFDLHKMAMMASYPWNKMIKRSFLKSINACFEEVPIGNDTWFSNYVGSKITSAYILNKKIYCYYIYPNNTTNRKRPLNHYYITINTTIKVNILKKEKGLLQYSFFPGFYTENVRREYGNIAVLKLYLYYLMHDHNSIRIILAKIKSRMKLLLHL